MQLGFIGVGNIGTPMCRHLIEAGHEVLVYDVNPSNMARMVSLGAQAGESPRAIAQACNIVFSSLPGPREIEQVALGAHGIIEAARPELIYVDLSTNSPTVARRVCAALAARGVTMLDAPVSGGVAGAERGTLAVMVGGAAQAFTTCKPLLQHIGSNVFHVGDSGSGCVVKLVNNMLAFVNATAAYEGMLLGVKAGVDPQMIYNIVQASSGASSAMQAFPNKIFAGDFAPGFMIDLAQRSQPGPGTRGRTLRAAAHGQRVHQFPARSPCQWPGRRRPVRPDASDGRTSQHGRARATADNVTTRMSTPRFLISQEITHGLADGLDYGAAWCGPWPGTHHAHAY